VRIVGLDPSLTSFGGAQARWDLDAAGPHLTTWRLTPTLRGHERLAFLLADVAERCAGADLVVLEGVFTSPLTAGTAMELSGLSWLVRHLLWEMSAPYAVVAPMTLKKWATGNAQADKVAMATEAVRRFPAVTEHITGDEADALWACAAGCWHAGYPLAAAPKDRVAALYAVEKSGRKRGRPKVGWPFPPAAELVS